MYFPMGADDAPNFNSTKYPGVCKPTNQATLELVYELQRQLNRIAQMKGLTKIAVDGDIGPGTVRLFNQAIGGSASCQTIASQVSTFTAQLNALAVSLNAPAKVSSPAPAKPPTYVNATTGLEVVAPKGMAASLSDSIGLSTPMLLLLGIAAIGAGYYLTRKPGASKPSVRYRTRHRTRYVTRRIRSRR